MAGTMYKLNEVDNTEIKIRAKKNSFSNRNGKNSPKNIQVNDFDIETRNILNTKCWDIFNKYTEQKFKTSRHEYRSVYSGKFESFIGDYLLNNVLNVSCSETLDFNRIKKQFNNVFEYGKYNVILDVIELIVSSINLKNINLYEDFNNIFEEYFVGYRFINKLICPISNDLEVKEIENAFSTNYDKVNSHIIKALGFLSDRDNPDYHNSIKESAMAIESLGNIQGNGGVYSNIKKITKKAMTNKLLYESIEKFINFVNQEPGIRHDNNNEIHEISFDEAKFCLVIASGIINYLLKYIEENDI